ncbi:hypothetical protein ACLX1H_005160 [Fusarium chlamydosporum]
MAHTPTVPGRARPDYSPAHGISTSSAGEDTSEFESGMSSLAEHNACNKNRSLKCTKPCCKGKGKAKDRRVKIVTSSDIESSENGDKATQTQSSTGDVSTGLDTAVKYTKPSVEDPNWSVSEDYRLRGMKEAGETWKFIASALCKPKNEVRARWRVLQSQTIASEATTESETREATTEYETGDATTEGESGQAAVEVGNNGASTSDNDDDTDGQDEEWEDTSEDGIDLENDGDDDTDGDEEFEEDENTDEETSFVQKPKGKSFENALVNNKWHKGTRNRKVAIENKWAKARAKAKTQNDDSSIESGQGASGNTSESSSRLGYGDPEKLNQMKYLQDHVYSEMYPADIHPQPDAYLGKRDCALLATIDSKYKRSRWLEMQANFYNVTGRMVPLEAIRDRCERAEAEKEERSEARKIERRRKK